MSIKTHSIKHRTLWFLGCLLLATLSFSSCKEDDPDDELQLPELGTCDAVSPSGNLSYIDSTETYLFRTSDGGTMEIDLTGSITIKHDDFPAFRIELWGMATMITSANHENLNGLHIKDRIADRRTLIFPEGAKITIVASDTAGDLVSISIYDGAQCHHINASCSTLEYSASDAAVTERLDELQADGEAGGFEFTDTSLIFFNSYTEDVAGDKVQNRENLGETFPDEPNHVRDYYDDPRLGHT